MSLLTCANCGNNRGWRNARQQDGVQEATCGQCGEVTRTVGGVTMGTVTGGMYQTSSKRTRDDKKK